MGHNLGEGCPNKPGGMGVLVVYKEQGLGEASLAPVTRVTHPWVVPVAWWLLLRASSRSPRQCSRAYTEGGSWSLKPQGWERSQGGGCEELSTAYLHSESGDLPARSLFQGTVLI